MHRVGEMFRSFESASTNASSITTLAVTSANLLLCHASTCFRIGSKVLCIRSTLTEIQSISEKDFECFASTGINSPANAIFEQTNTRYPHVIAKCMLLSGVSQTDGETAPCDLGFEVENPKGFHAVWRAAYSSWTTPMWRNPSVSTRVCTILWRGTGRCVSLPRVSAPALILRGQWFGRHNR
jgi:hypothetical protein